MLMLDGQDPHRILELFQDHDFLRNLFARRDETIFPLPFMILSDGGFHKRACLIAPDYPAVNQLENSFDSRISSARCVVENAFGLLKMKWRS